MTFSSSFGSYGSGDGQLNSSWDVAFDSTGNVYVADTGGCIQVFTAEGKFLRKFGKMGSGGGELCFPSSVSIDSDDVVYVTEYCNHCVSMFTSEGQFLRSFGTKGKGPGQFYEPCGIAVDRDGLFYISMTLATIVYKSFRIIVICGRIVYDVDVLYYCLELWPKYPL